MKRIPKLTEVFVLKEKDRKLWDKFPHTFSEFATMIDTSSKRYLGPNYKQESGNVGKVL